MRSYRIRMNRQLETAADRARRFRWRIRLMTGVFTLFFLVLAGRAVILMAYPTERLVTLARRQHQQVVTLYPKRGSILDRNGADLAMSVEMESVYADPKLIKDPDEAARALAPILNKPEAKLRSKLKRKLRFVWLNRRVRQQISDAVKALKIRGVNTVTETRRFYPNRSLAGALLGFTGIDNVGLEGLELKLNDSLTGQITRYVRLRDAKGRNITPEGVLVQQNLDGGDVTLTIDRTLQYAAEQALNSAYEEFEAKGGFVIVMDPRTGEILAMANAPGYNPNVYGQYGMAAYKNMAVANTFEPGSIMKSFLVASALGDQVIQVEDTFDCEGGNYRIGRNVVHDTHEYDMLSVAQIIKLSSNIGAAKIADRLGKRRLYEYYREFGYGESTESGLPGEVNGILRKPEKWSRIALATHAFGQGMAVTGIQVASALSAIANGGVRMQPTYIQSIRDADGNEVFRSESREIGRVIPEEVARTTTKMLIGVTEEGGTAPKAAIEGYHVAGKTGTAQKVDPALKRYAPGKFTSSFIGFVPAEDPRLVIVVVLDEPGSRRYYGGTVAGPVFAEVARVGMRYLSIPPLKEEEPEEEPEKRRRRSTKYKDLVAMVTQKDVAEQRDEREVPKLELKPVTQSEPVEGEEYILPDFSGQPMRSVLTAVNDKMFQLNVSGSGLAVDQSPKPGKTLRSGEKLTVVFSPEWTPPKTHRGRRR